MALKPEHVQGSRRIIPAGWRVRELGDIGECLIGLTYKPVNVKPSGILVLRSSNVSEGSLRFLDNVYVDVAVPDRIIVRRGDILICVRNGSRDLIGKCALIDDGTAGMTFGAFMCVFRTPYHDFVFQQFQSGSIKKQIEEHLGATINQITNKSLKSFQILMPDHEDEQRAVAAALSDTDTLHDRAPIGFGTVLGHNPPGASRSTIHTVDLTLEPLGVFKTPLCNVAHGAP